MNGLTMMTLAMGNPAGGPQQGGGAGMMIGYMVIIFALFYFMMIRPQQRKEKERKTLISNIKSGDRVIFGGGLVGIVANIKDKVFVIKIADNTKVEVVKGSITRVLLRDEDIGSDAKE